MGRIKRSLKTVRTHSARSNPLSIPYRAYLKISCLEMEKARLGKEKDSAVERVQYIDSRFREIEAEKRELLDKPGMHEPAGNVHSRRRVDGPAGFKFRY
ncbi:MAG: hypothetical protein HY646_13380 [Acidobacteria bacterium]|nr:hypothetical protein [Acidobacteriota bacterium]